MQKRVLGKTGEEVSILGFGCMRLPVLDPNDPSSIDYPLATAMVRKAIDNGVNYIDTAWPYHRTGELTEPGMSEPFVAQALRDGYRSKVKIATKLPTWLVENAKQMNDILDQQLKRLDTPCIDFYLAHNMNRNVWPKMREIGMLRFFDQARKDGRIKHAGFSFHDHYWVFDDIVKAYDWSFVQFQYNYLDTNFQAGTRGLELAVKRNLGVVVMEPLRGGFLVDNMPEEMTQMLAAVRPDWTLAEWGLRWVWNQPGVGVVLSGMNKMHQVEENLTTADVAGPMSAEEVAALEKVRTYFVSRLRVNCTGCGYCLPCPCGVNIPKIHALYNDYFMVDTEANHKRVKASYRMQISEAESANNCIACKRCEQHCPQNIATSKEMPVAAAIFE